MEGVVGGMVTEGGGGKAATCARRFGVDLRDARKEESRFWMPPLGVLVVGVAGERSSKGMLVVIPCSESFSWGS